MCLGILPQYLDMQIFNYHYVQLQLVKNPTKGQLILEWLFGVFNFPKKLRKNLMNICPKI